MKNRYLTVSAVTSYMKKKMDIDPYLKQIFIKGEISNFKQNRNGHMYFSLKDAFTRIPVAMFAGDNRLIKFKPEHGMSVLIAGQITIYDKGGYYQLIAKEMEPEGLGSLYLAYEQLKNELEQKGYFKKEYKKAIVKHPKSICLITSPTGAAIKDMLSTIKRRYPICDVTVIPVTVQGEAAKYSIANAINLANEQSIFDTIIVGRGGGSIEDLWAFNEMEVIEAVFQSKTPIISAVGHETDTTLVDFVADLRAPTPTGAAELAVPSLLDVQENVTQTNIRLRQLMQIHLSKKKERLSKLQSTNKFQNPKQTLYDKQQHLDQLEETIVRATERKWTEHQHALQQLHTKLYYMQPSKKINEQKEKLYLQKKALQQNMKAIQKFKKRQFIHRLDKLTVVNPLEIIKRGYAIPLTNNGKLIKTVEDIEEKEPIHIQMKDGSLHCEVISIRREKIDG